MTRRQGTRCCGKARYATEETALAALHRIACTATGRHPVRAYECGSGWWHLTSQPHPAQQKEPA